MSMNNDSETFENAVDSQIAKWWGINYPDEWNSLGAESGDPKVGDAIRNKLRYAYRILSRGDVSLQGGKRKRRRKTKKRRKKNRKKRTKRRR